VFGFPDYLHDRNRSLGRNPFNVPPDKLIQDQVSDYGNGAVRKTGNYFFQAFNRNRTNIHLTTHLFAPLTMPLRSDLGPKAPSFYCMSFFTAL
jgi:hypothetical protein